MQRREYNRRWVTRLKEETPCRDCGDVFPAAVMEFDHVTQAKLANISDLLDAPEQVLRAEIARCELVCANCHRVRTAVRRTEAHLAAADDADLLAM